MSDGVRDFHPHPLLYNHLYKSNDSPYPQNLDEFLLNFPVQSCHCTYVSPFCSFCPAYSIQGANKCHKSYQMTTLTPPQTQQFILLTVCRRAIHPTTTGRPIPESNTILLLLYYVHSLLLYTVPLTDQLQTQVL